MYLNINDGERIEDPSQYAVIEALRSLEQNMFVILHRGDEFYIQTYHDEDGTYQLEYRDGSSDRHYAVDPSNISVDDVCQAFSLFFDNEDLQSALSWQNIDVQAADPSEAEFDFSGLELDDDWPAQIESAQEVRTIALAGMLYERIPFGSEDVMEKVADSDCCGDCGALRGQLHVPECETEQCPRCQGQLMTCGCDLEDS